jgi:heme exporter protein D
MSTDTILNHYGNYLFLAMALSLILIFILLYRLKQSKKSLKNIKELLSKKEIEIENLYGVITKAEQKETQEKHQGEKEILELNHKIRTLEEKLKEGIKSQVISKIVEYQNRRSKVLDRVGIDN